MDALKKVYQIEFRKENIDDENAILTAIVASEKRDRDGEIIRLTESSMDLTGYRKNPVLLWQHRPDSPIGKALKIGIVKKQLIAKFEFHRKTQISREIFDLYGSNFLNSFSVGFRALEKRDENKVYRKTELLEISCVSIPSNIDAITQNGYGEKITDDVLRKDLNLQALESPAPIFDPEIFASALKKAMNPESIKEAVREGAKLGLERLKERVITLEKEDRMIEVDLNYVQRLVDKNILEYAMKDDPEMAKKIISKRVKEMKDIELGKLTGKVF